MRKLYVILPIIMLVFITGCTTSEPNNSVNISNQTKSEKIRDTVYCQVLYANGTPMVYASVNTTYNTSEYSDGFPGDKHSYKNAYTDENGTFSVLMNKTVQFNFTITESDSIYKRELYTYSTLFIPMNNECILKPSVTETTIISTTTQKPLNPFDKWWDQPYRWICQQWLPRSYC